MSPGSQMTSVRRYNNCCEPLVINSSSALLLPARRSCFCHRRRSSWRNCGKPIVVPYCRAARAVFGFDRISRVIAETSSTGNVSLSVNPAASEIRSRFSNASRINQLIGGSVVRRARAEKCDGAWFIASDGAAVSTTLRGSPTCPCSHCQVRLRMPARDCTPCSCRCL